MWILNYLPSWFIHLIPITGVALLLAAVFIKYIPFINRYNLLVKIAGVLLLLGGTWIEGGYYYYHQAEAEIKRIEKESKEATDKIQKEYEGKLAQTKQRGDTIVQYVEKYVTKEADAKCVIPNNFVVLHDSAAHSKIPDSTRLADESASGVTLSTTAKTVVQNYNQYYEIREQLISLQKWVNEQKKIRE